MQQPRMIVLALIGMGLRYGFEMEAFAQRTRMRQWAKIGTSTIYKVLADLEREGAVVATAEDSEKGPPRKSYALTSEGRGRMGVLIGEAVTSGRSLYSERIAGLVFAPLLAPERAREAIAEAIAWLDQAERALGESRAEAGMDEIGRAVVDFYRSVHAAERIAMERVLKLVR